MAYDLSDDGRQEGRKILVIGSGGREHALAWKLAQSSRCQSLYVAPGNAGTQKWNVPIEANDIEGLVQFALDHQIDLTLVGPEEPLSLGVVDRFKEKGLNIFGPTKAAARLESSKAFAKEIMDQAKIPTAEYQTFQSLKEARTYIEKMGAPIVIKADGLAAGKGVIVANILSEAIEGLETVMSGTFGTAGDQVVIEEYLEGQEVSLLCFCDGNTAIPMVPVQDHKRALNGDLGLNTGGMGTYSPPPFWTKELEEEVIQTIALPTLKAMADRGTPFQGVLFLGLMITAQGPKLLEYNVRFGDPETQVVMILLQSDLLTILEQSIAGKLSETALVWYPDTSCCVVMASPGYPGPYEKGIPLQLPELQEMDQVIFHAGTGLSGGQLANTGGRVLGVTVRGKALQKVREMAYTLVEEIDFPRGHYRTDIGLKGLKD